MLQTLTIWPQSAGQPVKFCYPLKNRFREKEESKDEGQLKDQPALEHGEELDMLHKWQCRVVEPGPKQRWKGGRQLGGKD